MVEVAFVVVACSPVKFCRVEEPVVKMFPAVRSEVMKALVPFNEVAKRLVEVACEVVAFRAVKFWRVVEDSICNPF